MMSVFSNKLIMPNEVFAGDSEQFCISLTVGTGYTSGPSRLILDFPGTLGMSRPSLVHEEEPGLINVLVSNPHVTWDKHIWDIEGRQFVDPAHLSYRGMAARLFVLDLSAGLTAGDLIEIHWGETKGGYGTGTKVTTVVPKPAYDAELHVRYFDVAADSAPPGPGLPDYGRDMGDDKRPVPDAAELLTFRVKPREPRSIRVLRLQDHALVLPLDRFCNVCDLADLVESSAPLTRNAMGALECAAPDVRITSRVLPVFDAPSMTNVTEGYNLYWGDLHTHSSFSNDCIEREKLQMTPADLMQFARQRAGLDFYAVTDHHQPWDIERNKIGRTGWDSIRTAALEACDEGKFLGLTGIEYRGPRGDTAVVFGWYPEYDEILRPEWVDIRKLWEELKGRDYLSIPHFHNLGRLPDGEWWRGPEEVEPVLEMFSCHGSFEMDKVLEQLPAMCKKRRPDRNAVWMLDQGIKFGLCANSDGHKGHVGSNGVTAVFAEELTQQAIFDAYRARRVYATTNARIRLVFRGNGALMGETVPNADKKVFVIDVCGEHTLKKIELIGNGRVQKLFEVDGKAIKMEHVVQDANPGYWYVRATQHDNHVAWSSPVWFE